MDKYGKKGKNYSKDIPDYVNRMFDNCGKVFEAITDKWWEIFNIDKWKSRVTPIGVHSIFTDEAGMKFSVIISDRVLTDEEIRGLNTDGEIKKDICSHIHGGGKA